MAKLLRTHIRDYNKACLRREGEEEIKVPRWEALHSQAVPPAIKASFGRSRNLFFFLPVPRCSLLPCFQSHGSSAASANCERKRESEGEAKVCRCSRWRSDQRFLFASRGCDTPRLQLMEAMYRCLCKRIKVTGKKKEFSSRNPLHFPLCWLAGDM